MVGGLRDVITCAEFQIEIFIGYDFTGGRIFDFPIDFSMGLTTVQRYCAACDMQVLGDVSKFFPLGGFRGRRALNVNLGTLLSRKLPEL